MLGFQRLGGLAALFEAATFVVGFWVYFALLGPARYGAADVDAARHVAFLVDNQQLLTAWNLVIYVAFGAVLVVLTLALQRRLRDGAPVAADLGAAFGLIWAGLVIASGMVANVGMGVIADLQARSPAEAATVWLAYKFVVGGLGGGNEIVGGLWMLLVSCAAFQARQLPRWLNALGAVIGVSGVLTAVPPLGMLGEVFGLGLIVWFLALGVAMLRNPEALEPRSRIAPFASPTL